MVEAAHPENAKQTPDVTETPIETTGATLIPASFQERFRRALLLKYSGPIDQGHKLKAMEEAY